MQVHRERVAPQTMRLQRARCMTSGRPCAPSHSMHYFIAARSARAAFSSANRSGRGSSRTDSWPRRRRAVRGLRGPALERRQRRRRAVERRQVGGRARAVTPPDAEASAEGACRRRAPASSTYRISQAAQGGLRSVGGSSLLRRQPQNTSPGSRPAAGAWPARLRYRVRHLKAGS